MHITGTLDDFQAISVIDDIPEFSTFSFALVFPQSVSELEPGNGEGVRWEKFCPNGDASEMPPYRGVMLSMGYRYDELAGCELTDENGNDGAYFLEIYELGNGKPPVYLTEVVVPSSPEAVQETIGEDTLYEWLYETGVGEFYSASGH